MSALRRVAERQAFAPAPPFQGDFHACPTARYDERFELADPLPCADRLVVAPVDLTLPAQHRRGQGVRYAALNRGRIETGHLRRTPAAVTTTDEPATAGQ